MSKNIFYNHKLKCNENGEFTVLVVADPQCEKSCQWHEAAKELEILVEKEKPDFVLINGDMETNNLISRENWEIFVEPITTRNIFWSTVNGNHDPFSEEINRMYMSFDRCLNATVDCTDEFYEEERPLNYCLTIQANNSEKVVFAIYAMDSGKDYDDAGWQGYTPKQINWYRRCSNELKKENGNKPVTSLMCCHIPFHEIQFMEILHGVCNENIGRTSINFNFGTFDAIKEQGDVKIAVFGHSHKINRIGIYEGVLLGYAGKISTGSYHDELARGGRIIRFNQNEPLKVVTYWSAALSTSENQPPVTLQEENSK